MNPRVNAVEFAKPRRSRVGGKRDVGIHARAVSDLPQHQRRRVAAKPREARRFDAPCRPMKSQPAQRSSTGRFPKSGTSATPISKTPPAAASSTFSKTICMWSTTACRSMPGCRWKSSCRGSIRCPSIPIGFPIARPITRNPGVFACRSGSWRVFPTASTRSSSTQRLQDGALTYGECVLPGQIDDEFLISVHICHPSLCNDNLSGVAVAPALARILAPISHRYTYRFLFVPGTIGPIAWLSRNQAAVQRVKHGLVLACVGDRGNFNYKRSRRLNADIDRAVEHVLAEQGRAVRGPGLLSLRLRRTAVLLAGLQPSRGKLSAHAAWRIPRVSHARPTISTSCRRGHLADSLATLLEVIDLIESDLRFINLSPMGEPQLGRRGLFPRSAARRQSRISSLCFGSSISQTAITAFSISPSDRDCPSTHIRRAIEALTACGLLEQKLR